MQSKQHRGTLIFSSKSIDFQHIDELCASHIVHFAPRILCNKLNFAHSILCNKLKSLSWIQFIRLHRYYKVWFSITLLLLDFDWHCLASGSLSKLLSCWCGTQQQCGQGISGSAVDWQQLPTASILLSVASARLLAVTVPLLARRPQCSGRSAPQSHCRKIGSFLRRVNWQIFWAWKKIKILETSKQKKRF